MNANSGKGQIIEKNKLLLHVDASPWLNKSNMTACRHGNGRDWWLLKPSARNRDMLYKFLVTPDTIITFTEIKPATFSSTFNHDNVGQSCFSKDGSLYVECNANTAHTIYDFDRCSGELTIKRVINLQAYQDTFGKADGGNGPLFTGVCFSPNNRFLYASDYYNIYQIDLWEPNDALAIRRVSKDTTYYPTPFGFPGYESMQLTPTGVVYLGYWNGISPNVNAILYPDKLGDACGFTFDYLQIRLSNYLWYNTTLSPPNNPFYGLGALVGSGCDTSLPSPPKEGEESWVVYPNPARELLVVSCKLLVDKEAIIDMYNCIGQLLYSSPPLEGREAIEINVSHLPSGIYYLRVGNLSKKVIVE